jgi:tetratricopeptide (TPR) repeat protein
VKQSVKATGFLLLVVLTFAWPAGAQNPPGLEQLAPTTGTVVVRVRAPGGVGSFSFAVVRLYSDFKSLNITENTRENNEATFRNIPIGEYNVEVRAPGYAIATAEVSMFSPGATAYCYVELKSEGTASESVRADSDLPLFTPKARKELDEAAAAIQAADWKSAEEHLKKALKMASGHPDVYYLWALYYVQKREYAAARAQLEKALEMYPRHAGAQAMLGRVLFQMDDYAGAVKALEKALELKPDAWQSHLVLAMAFLTQGEHEKARGHAESALALAKDKSPDAAITLAQALIGLGQREQAIKELNGFLAANAKHPRAGEAAALLAGLHPATGEPRVASLSADAAGARAAPPPALLPPLAADRMAVSRRWLPSSVDEVQPQVFPGATCAQKDVLEALGRRVKSLADNLARVGATEKITFIQLDEQGNRLNERSRTFEYVVEISEVRRGEISVDEYRRDRAGDSTFPTRLATKGLAALALVFHPYYAGDFEMKCEGLAEWNSQQVWSIYFVQRKDKRSRVRSYTTGKGRFEVRLKGRAYVAASTLQVVRLETDLLEPIKLLQLEAEHLIIDYEPVDFKTRKARLWLPARADYYSQFEGRRILQQHRFGDYLLFHVDVGEKHEKPKVSGPDRPN